MSRGGLPRHRDGSQRQVAEKGIQMDARTGRRRLTGKSLT